MKCQVMRNTFIDFPKDAVSDSITQDAFFYLFFYEKYLLLDVFFCLLYVLPNIFVKGNYYVYFLITCHFNF